jgi:ribulose-phosphate 3-epimerase
MNKIQLAPSILSADFLKLEQQVKELDSAGVEVLHIDVMDGHFVPNITFGPFIVRALRKITNMTLDVHLMISEPDLFIEEFANAGSDYITVHAEAPIHLHRTIQLIKSFGKKAGVSLNPASPESLLEYVYPDLDLVLVMSVNPGFGGQAFIPKTIEKIKNINKVRERNNHNFIIEVDGGVSEHNAKELIDSGANWLVAGSAVFKGNLQERVETIVKSFT